MIKNNSFIKFFRAKIIFTDILKIITLEINRIYEQ